MVRAFSLRRKAINATAIAFHNVRPCAAPSPDANQPSTMRVTTKTVTAQAGAEWFPSDPGQKPHDIALAALDHAKRHYFDVLLVDTAGGLPLTKR